MRLSLNENRGLRAPAPPSTTSCRAKRRPDVRSTCPTPTPSGSWSSASCPARDRRGPERAGRRSARVSASRAPSSPCAGTRRGASRWRPPASSARPRRRGERLRPLRRLPGPRAPRAPRAQPPPPRRRSSGPPNSGKSTLFNRLTGLRQKVANYPGVTVEERRGPRPPRRGHARSSSSTCPASTA